MTTFPSERRDVIDARLDTEPSSANGPPMPATKQCPTCKRDHQKRTIYCRAECYYASEDHRTRGAALGRSGKGRPKSATHRANISRGTTGKPKPWVAGERNPNFGNQAQGKPEARARFLSAVRARGQAWTEDDRARHSATMLGDANAMRGRNHTAETKARVAAAKQQQYRDGVVRIRRYKLSRAEREIGEWLRANGHEVISQFHIKGVPYLYDFYLPALNLLIEYNGDYWHANPRRYPPGTLLPFQNAGKVPVEDIWARDAAKAAAATASGYRLAYVWESDFKARGVEAVTCLLVPD